MISIIIPTLNRSHQLIDSLVKLEETTKGIPIEIVVIADQEDIKTIEIVKLYFQSEVKERVGYILQVVKGHPTPVEKWNSGAARSSGEWLVLGADDIDWTKDWLRLSLDTPNQGFIGLRDFELSDRWFCPHYMATREWLRTYNGGVLTIPHYKHWGIDGEIAKRAYRANNYVVSKAILPHKHPIWNMGKNDSTYEKAKPFYQIDIDMFYAREKAGFPDNFNGFL